ncbi:hypothetical protein IQ235_08505 [Oscillatoriales cyanobacterium LEGE 11467]|uniref:Uncharacterized protein n=1 Tax=Zarconia navalis LEGE 11467 TaxID=1828826 RepID=A0A928VWZ3_9CYAN|nr:hypothetical protein [Zarconia navalis LEGE 11467]
MTFGSHVWHGFDGFGDCLRATMVCGSRFVGRGLWAAQDGSPIEIERGIGERSRLYLVVCHQLVRTIANPSAILCKASIFALGSLTQFSTQILQTRFDRYRSGDLTHGTKI